MLGWSRPAAARTSLRKLALDSGSASSSLLTTLRATGKPIARWVARQTRPIPPVASSLSRVNGPMCSGAAIVGVDHSASLGDNARGVTDTNKSPLA